MNPCRSFILFVSFIWGTIPLIQAQTTITFFSPTSATTGQTVVIRGNNLANVTQVRFGGVAAASFSKFTDTTGTRINAVVGSGASGFVSVRTATDSAVRSGFTFLPPATTISSFSPASATTGQTVVIRGNNLANVTQVRFGGIAAASFTKVADSTGTRINAVVGSGASGFVVVRTATDSAVRSGFTFIPPTTTITSFSPTSAAKGQTVVIKGNNLANVTQVRFGGVLAASFTKVADSAGTNINAVVGDGASGVVSVKTATDSAVRAGFTYVPPPPSITSFTPESAGPGAEITITGISLSGATAVRFGGKTAASFTIINSTQIKAIVGTGASGEVSIVFPSDSISKQGFTFIAPIPEVTSFAPLVAGKGSAIQIRGNNLNEATGVQFGGTPAQSFALKTDTAFYIEAIVDSATTGPVTVINFYGSGSSLLPFTIDTPRNFVICPKADSAIVSSLTGSSYQWQYLTDTGYADITPDTVFSNATNANLFVNDIPSSYNGKKLRCKIDGNILTGVVTISITNTWTGAVNDDFNNPGNWSCGLAVPDSNTNVVVNSGSVNVTANTEVNSIKVNTGANVTVTPGTILIIKNQ